jgi:hypothetical protein
VTSLLLLGAGALAAWHLASGAGIAAVRRGALLSALITLVLVLNCSATRWPRRSPTSACCCSWWVRSWPR